MSGADVAAAARRLVGTPFRLRGRDPATGLDCVGLVGCALAASGHSVRLPKDYSLHSLDIGPLLPFAGACGLGDASGDPEPGDVVLFQVGLVQFHLAVADGLRGFVHANAGLRRVVAGPADPQWPIARLWRLPAKEE